MVMHGGMFGMAAYLVMTQVMQQSPSAALGRSVLVANGVSSYMILFWARCVLINIFQWAVDRKMVKAALKKKRTGILKRAVACARKGANLRKGKGGLHACKKGAKSKYRKR